jgi:hypothetical protein
MQQIIYYSLFLHDEAGASTSGQTRSREQNAHYLSQLQASVLSIRRVNKTIPVYVFAYGDDIPPPFLRELFVLGVECSHLGTYEDALQPYVGKLSKPLARYPTLHRWLSLRELLELPASQIIYLDCDTWFVRDPGPFFERFSEHSLYAREEPFSRRSEWGYDPDAIDEDALGALARSVGARILSPFNIGLLAFDHRFSREICQRLHVLFSFVVRLIAWMHQHPDPGADSDGLISEMRDGFAGAIASGDVVIPLAYPSRNRWIVDEVALWLTLGGISNFSVGWLPKDQILQGDEFATSTGEFIGCHYYARNQTPFLKWARKHGFAPPRSS